MKIETPESQIINVDKNITETVGQNVTETVGGNVSETVSGSQTTQITGNLDVDANRIDLN